MVNPFILNLSVFYEMMLIIYARECVLGLCLPSRMGENFIFSSARS